jgi:cytochrome P450
VQIANDALLERYPSIDLAGEVEWKPSFIIRGLQSLPMALTTRRSLASGN